MVSIIKGSMPTFLAAPFFCWTANVAASAKSAGETRGKSAGIVTVDVVGYRSLWRACTIGNDVGGESRQFDGLGGEVKVLQSLSKRQPTEALQPFFMSPRRSPRQEIYADAGVEPALNDLLSDPLTTVLMRRDGVRLDDLRALLAQTRAMLKSR